MCSLSSLARFWVASRPQGGHPACNAYPLTVERTVRYRTMLLICPDGVEVPQLGEFQGAGTVAVGLLDLDNDSLEMFRVVIQVVERQGEILLFQGFLVDNRYCTVDAHRIIHARDEKQQADMRIGIQVLVGLKEFIASHIGHE